MKVTLKDDLHLILKALALYEGYCIRGEGLGFISEAHKKHLNHEANRSFELQQHLKLELLEYL